MSSSIVDALEKILIALEHVDAKVELLIDPKTRSMSWHDEIDKAKRAINKLKKEHEIADKEKKQYEGT
jgi:hypothetical protein